MDFLYSFFTFLQPGTLWPELAAYRPIFVLSVVAGAVGLVRRPPFPRAVAFAQPAFRYLMFFIAAQVLSVYYSGVSSMLEELGYWYVYPMFVAISILLISSALALKRYVWGMITGSTAVVLYGLYAVYAKLPSAVQGRAGAYGMYENHNDYSFVIIMVLPFLYLYWRAETGGFRRTLLALSMLACVAGIFLSLSRGGMLALVLELGLIVLLAVDRKRRALPLLLLALFGSAAISYQWAMRAENQGESYTYEDAENSRIELWKAAKNMALTHPLLGVGSRRFPEFSQAYGEIGHDGRGKVAHNTYVEIIATSGLLGVIPFILMLRSILRALKVPAGASAPQCFDATRRAALISLYATMFRALFDAKAHDWSFYTLCVIAIAYTALQHSLQTGESVKDHVPVPREAGRRMAKVLAGKGVERVTVRGTERP